MGTMGKASEEDIRLLKEWVSKMIPRKKLGYMKVRHIGEVKEGGLPSQG